MSTHESLTLSPWQQQEASSDPQNKMEQKTTEGFHGIKENLEIKCFTTFSDSIQHIFKFTRDLRKEGKSQGSKIMTDYHSSQPRRAKAVSTLGKSFESSYQAMKESEFDQSIANM